MTRRTRIAAVFAAAGLLSMAASAVIAAPPTYALDVAEAANPTAVPLSGASVDFTVTVTATGTGFFQTVDVASTLAGCTFAGPTGDVGSDGKLSPSETWTYTCTVANVVPGDTNTANVDACHGTGACTVHDATGSASVTLDEAPAGSTAPSAAPPSAPPPSGPAPSQGVGDVTQAPSDTDGIVAAPRGTDLRSMLVLLSIMFFLVASIIVVKPAASKSETKP
jgi:hypothetical protein